MAVKPFFLFVLKILRLHPSVPVDSKEAVKDDVFPDGTPVPAGTAVSFCVHAMGRDPDLWPNPMEFR